MAVEASFSHDHLSQFSGARINPYAVQVAAQICKDFKLSVAGQRRLNKALNDLPCINTVDPALSFAWSMDHVIRSPRVHQFGYEHLTIVITLAECFHETYAAEVFHALAKRVLPKSRSTPHVYQWLDMLHFCNGILAGDDFGLVVESFILLDPYNVTPGGKYSSDRCLIPVGSVADALIAFSELICGKRIQLTLRGGGMIGWFAALAEHFYDITVTIESKSGEHLHGLRDTAQLSLIYTEKPELVIEDASMPGLVQSMTNISIAPLSRQIHFLPYGGRCSWQTLLPQVFGRCFHDLDHQHTKLMYTAIGSAFKAIEGAKDSSSIGPKQHASIAIHPPPASAEQLITRLTEHVGSLQRGQGKMERLLKISPQEAAKTHLEQMQQLASICNCIFCSTSHDTPTVTTSVNGSGVTMDESEVTVYCLPSIVGTIVMIGLMLSRIVLDRHINPSREGVQLLYKLRTDKLVHLRDHNVLTPSSNTVAAIYDDALNAPTSYILRMAVKFFAGGHLPPLGSDRLPIECVAIAHDGICAYAAELVGGRNVRKDLKGMVRIVNGAFGIREKTYRLAAWNSKRPEGWEGWQWEEIEDLEHLKDETGGKLWFK